MNISFSFSGCQAIMEIWGVGNTAFFMGTDYTPGVNNKSWFIKRMVGASGSDLPVTHLHGSAMDAWGTSDQSVFFVGDNAQIIHFNGSAFLFESEIPTQANLNGVWGSSENDVYAVGSDGTILHYDGIPTPITLIAPEHESVQNGTFVSFEWEAVSWADAYILTISETPEMDQIVVNGNVGNVTNFNITGFEDYGRPYYWQITAITDEGLFLKSEVFSFNNGIAQAPILITPMTGSNTPGTSVKFAWHPFETSTHYLFQLATDVNFTNMVIQGYVYDAEITLNGFGNNGTDYYWRVVGVNGSTLGPYWSYTFGFTNGTP